MLKLLQKLPYAYIVRVLLILQGVLLSSSVYSVGIERSDFLDGLTPKERVWLRNNIKVTYTGNPDWLPFEAFDSSGDYIGIAADHLDLIEELTGLEFEKIPVDSLVDALQLAVSNKVDLISGDVADEILNKTFQSVGPYASNKISIIMRYGEPNVDDLYDIADAGIGIILGYGYTEELKREYPGIVFQEVEDINAGLEKVSSGNLGALLAPRLLGTYSMSLNGYQDLKFVGSTDVTMTMAFFVSNQKAELLSIINKAFRYIYPSQKIDIFSRWAPESSENFSESNLSINLTEVERDYLKNISPIKFSGDPDWLPYEAFDENGRYIGQVADHIELVQQLLGVKFEMVPTSTWSESVNLARTGVIDVLSETDHSVLNGEALFTNIYSSTPVVIVMRNSENYVESIEVIKNKKIALVKDYGNTIEIRKQHPNIPFVSVDTIENGLVGVSAGEFDALLVSSPQAIFNIKRIGLNNIKIVGKTEFETRLAFAINPNRSLLVDIFNKALSAIVNSSQQQEIFDKWNSVEYSEKVDYVLIYQILGISLIIFILGIFWAYRLKKDIARRKKIEEELSLAKEQANVANQAKSRFLAVVSHELRTPLNGILGMLELLIKSHLDTGQQSMINVAINSSENLLKILNDILDFSKIEANKMDVIIEPGNIKELVENCVNTLVSNAYDKSLEVEMFISPELNADFQVDPVKIRQIINNFLNNAIKFTSKGRISIRASVVQSSYYGCEFTIVVEDTGVGISKKNQQQLFQEFVQVDMASNRQFGGSGLGLSICKKLAMLMGGVVKLQSRINSGTRISYTQMAKYSEKHNKRKLKWSGSSVALLTQKADVRDMLEEYLNYYGATTFSPMIMPSDPAVLKDLLVQEKINILIMDKALSIASDNSIYNEEQFSDIKIIHLVKEGSLSANDGVSKVGELNTNPLQPSFLELLVDLFLGIADDPNLLPDQSLEHSKPKPINLLVAEDHPTNRALICRQLDYLGYQYTLVENGQEAITAWQAQQYDGVLTDCHMPIVDGYELAQHLRKVDGGNKPIIAMTANALTGERSKCIESGMNDLLVKPVSISALNKCLRKWFPYDDTDMSLFAAGQFISESSISEPSISEPSISEQATPEEVAKICTYTYNDAYQQLADVFFGEENVMPMLKSYWSATDSDIVDLKQALSNKNRVLLKEVAHKMKGAAKIVLAEELVTITQTIENESFTIDFDELSNMIDKLERSLVVYKESLASRM